MKVGIRYQMGHYFAGGYYVYNILVHILSMQVLLDNYIKNIIITISKYMYTYTTVYLGTYIGTQVLYTSYKSAAVH